MLGVFIGVAALIAMVAVGQGANDAVRKQIESLGTNLVVVVPGARTIGGARGGLGSASTLTVSDAQAIRREAPAVGEVAYLIRQSGQVQYANQNWTTGIQGITANYPLLTNWQIAAGRSISPEDDSQAALVVVIGETVHRQLFGADQNPIGAVMQVKGVPLRVIGVFASKGQTSFGTDQDDLVMIPFTTAERKVLGVAAPSQQQAQLNWIYPDPPNPYGLQRRLVSICLDFFGLFYFQKLSVANSEINDDGRANTVRIGGFFLKVQLVSWPRFLWTPHCPREHPRPHLPDHRRCPRCRAEILRTLQRPVAHREKRATQPASNAFRLGASRHEQRRLNQTCVQRTGRGTQGPAGGFDMP